MEKKKIIKKKNSNKLTDNPEKSVEIPDSEPIIGIDLGTKNCCVAIYKNNLIQVLENENGKRTTPSIVTYKNGQILIGQAAEYLMYTNIKNTMIDSKRLIGRLFKEKEVQNDLKYIPVEIIEDPNTKKPQYVIKNNNNTEKKFLPIEISTLILKNIKEFSETRLGKKINKAVITVPANFNNFQREETKEAAKKAGLDVIKILNEPTAAAIAYGYENRSNKEKKVLIFDLGGGTFDVSILKIIGNEYYVLSSYGDSHLGGQDFNQRLFDYVLKEYKEKNNLKNIDFYDTKNDTLMKRIHKLKKKIEEIKQQLSFSECVEFDIDSLCNDIDFQMKIKRSEYEKLCIDLWEKCFIKIDKAIQLAKLKKDDINEIILVGGSSRTPKIKEMVINYFKNKEVYQNINVDEVIAQGAALVPYFGKNIHENNEFLKSAQLHEITNLSIGIEVAYNQMKIIIPKGTLLPSSDNKIFKQSFQPQNKNIKDINVKIYEGEDDFVWGNHLLGRFKIKDLKKGNNIIDIEMILDHNSILTVVAKVNGKKIESLVITKNCFYDEEEAQNYETKTDWIKTARKKINNDNKKNVDD